VWRPGRAFGDRTDIFRANLPRVEAGIRSRDDILDDIAPQTGAIVLVNHDLPIAPAAREGAAINNDAAAGAVGGGCA
jgi:hypothetical protein